MGAGTKVAIGDDLVLDFSGLFSTGPGCPPQAAGSRTGEALAFSGSKPEGDGQKPAEGEIEATEGIPAQALFLKAQRDKAEREKTLAVYQRYQENKKESSQLQTDILKGLKAGEDVYSLFLKAAKAMSLMLSDTQFYAQVEADLVAIYGRGLLVKPILQEELQGAQGRLQRLLEAEQREPAGDTKERIHKAIEAHRTSIAALGEMVAQTSV